jgi:hypothetical protein
MCDLALPQSPALVISERVDAAPLSPLCGGESEFLALAQPGLRIRKRGE